MIVNKGDMVMFKGKHQDIDIYKKYMIVSEPWEVSGKRVVKLGGLAGCFLESCLKPIKLKI